MKKETFENFVEVADARLYGTSKRRTIFFKAMTSVLALNMLTLGMTPAAYGSVLGSLADVDGKVAAGTYTGLDAGTFLDAADDITVGTAATDKSVFQTSGKWEITGGKLTAPGNIFLLAGGGLTFSGGTIDVGGLVAAAMNGFEFDATYKPGDVSGDVTVSGTSINAGYKVFIGQNVTGADGTILETRGITAKDTGDVTFSVAENGATITFVNAKITEGNIKADTVDFGDGGEVSANINADTIKLNTGKELTQSGGTIDTSKIEGAVTQSGGNLGKSGATIEITGKLTQTAGAQVDADTLTVAGGSSVAGTVNAGTITITGAEALAASGAINAGEITGSITQSGGTIKGANGTGDVKIDGALTQTAGAIDASTLTLGADSEVAGTVNANTVGAGTTTLKVSGSADVNVTETLTAGTLDVDGGAVDAKNITAKVDQDGGAITVTETIKGDVEVDGATSTLKAAKVDGKLTQDNGTVGEAGKALEVTGALTQNGGTIDAGDLTLGSTAITKGTVNANTIANTGLLTQEDGAINAGEITGAVTQNGGEIKGANGTGDVKIDGALTQNGGTIDADTLTLGADSKIDGDVTAKKIDATGKTITQNGAGTITVTGADGITATKVVQTSTSTGTIKTDKVTGDFEQNGDAKLQANTAANGLTITGSLSQDANNATVGTTDEDVKIGGALTQTAGTIDASTLTLVAASSVAGTVNATKIENTGALTQEGGTITAGEITGAVTQNDGTIKGNAEGNANVTITGALTQNGGAINAGELTLGSTATTKGTVNANTIANTGLLTQEAGTINAGEITGAVTQNGGEINGTGDVKIDGALTQNGGTIDADTLTLGADSKIDGDVTAKKIDATGKTITQNGAGTITVTGADGITATKVVQTSKGTIKTDKVTGDVEQKGAAKLQANTVANGLTITGSLSQDANDATVGTTDENVTIGALDQDKGIINAKTLTLDADSEVAGTVNATKIDATGKTITQNGAGTITVTGADGITATKVVQTSKGTIKTDKVTGDVEQKGAAKLQANTVANGLTITGTLTQNADGATVGTTDEDVTIGALDQDKGIINAGILTLKGGASQTAGEIKANSLVLDGATADVSLTSDKNDFDTISGTVQSIDLVDANSIQLGNITGTKGVSVSAETITINGTTVKAGAFDIPNSGMPTIAAGDNASLTLNAANSVQITGGAKVGASGTVDINSGTDGVTVSGVNTQLAANDAMTVDANGGSVTIKESAFVGGNSTVLVGADGTTTSVEVNGAQLVAKGDVTVKGIDSVTVTGAKIGSDANTTIEADTITADADSEILAKDTLDLDATAGDIKVAGKVISKDADLKAAGDITLANAANDFRGAVVAEGKNVTLVDADNGIELGKVTATGNLDVNAKGAITQSGAADVEGTTKLIAKSSDTEKFDITLANEANDFTGAVAADGENIKLVDANSIQLGNITGTKGVSVSAETITINGTTVKAGAFDIPSSGMPTIAAGDNASLTLNAANSVQITGGAKVGASGTVDINSGTDGVTVSGVNTQLAANDAMTVDANGGSVTIKESAFVGGNSTVLVGADGTTTSVEVNGAQLVAKGDVTVKGTDSVTVTGAKIGSDANTTIEADTITADAASEVLAKNTLKLNATAGAINVEGKVIATDADLDAAGDITLNNENNDFRGIVAADGANVTLVDANSIKLGEVTATGNLDVTAEGEGTITQSDVAKVTGTTTLVANGNNITLDNSANDFGGAVTATGNNVKLVDADAIELGEVKADGYFVAQALVGNIDVTDTITAKNTLLDAKGDITVDATVDGENVTLNAGNDVVENAAVNATADKVVVAGNNIEANSSFDANNAVYKAGNEVAFNGAAEVAGVLGVQAKNDITVAGTGIKADTLVLRSTAGDIDVEISGKTQNLAVQADKGTANVVAKDIKIVSGASAVTKRVNADGVASDNESVAANGITGKAGVTADIDGNLNASSITGGDVALNVNGNADVDSISGGDIDLDVAGNAGIDSIDGANIDANIADNAELSSIDGDSVNLVIGSDLTVDEMSAGDVIAEVGGNFAVGQVTADNVEMLVNGDLEDNDSLVEVDNLIADVGGDIGSVNDPINIKAKKIESVKGRNVNLNDKTVAGTVELGSIKASGNLNLTANDIGSAAGNAGGYVNANGLAGNLEAGGSINLNVGGFFGEADNPMVVTFGDKLSVGGGNMVENPDILIHAIYNGTVGGTVIYPHNYGFVIANGQFIAGNVEKIRAINRALAFTVNTPELKSTQGVFGEPSFIHLNMSVSDATSMGVVDTLTLNNISYFKTFNGLYRDEAIEAIENWVPAIDILDQQLSDKLDGFMINEDARTQPDIMDLTMNR